MCAVADILSVIEYLEQTGCKERAECPKCHAPMQVARRVEPMGLSPPEEYDRAA